MFVAVDVVADDDDDDNDGDDDDDDAAADDNEPVQGFEFIHTCKSKDHLHTTESIIKGTQ